MLSDHKKKLFSGPAAISGKLPGDLISIGHQIHKISLKQKILPITSLCYPNSEFEIDWTFQICLNQRSIATINIFLWKLFSLGSLKMIIFYISCNSKIMGMNILVKLCQLIERIFYGLNTNFQGNSVHIILSLQNFGKNGPGILGIG